VSSSPITADNDGALSEQVGDRLRFTRLEQPKAHEFVAEQLRREITLGLIEAGRKLPSERDLAKLFGVSRVTIQQALNLLESDRLLRARRGRGGGTFVTDAPLTPGGSQQLIERIRQDRAIIAEAVECRRTVEPAAAADAARLRSEEDLGRLRELHARAQSASDDAEFTSIDSQLHLAIAETARNRFLLSAVKSVRLALVDAILVLPETPLWQSKSLREHEVILAAITEGDVHAARKAMADHIAHTAQSITALLKAL
jgi:GntR family transcriptional regulator, transcriptional repressor for pyruvate dehydrogenase complex